VGVIGGAIGLKRPSEVARKVLSVIDVSRFFVDE
jgi:hypothetical protein